MKPETLCTECHRFRAIAHGLCVRDYHRHRRLGDLEKFSAPPAAAMNVEVALAAAEETGEITPELRAWIMGRFLSSDEIWVRKDGVREDAFWEREEKELRELAQGDGRAA